ncbi:hypothetical protein SAMN05192569_105321 [Parageobacillus thermantarcticus]|uniref:Uncharacterized protein n=1 Tax=Parageobacillus thermantarcticus TaxID=186116 RepID=A0A1I0TS54_9BACL|nr:hypothetical protein [Parageobacillus thermantarcticus]SFA54634.1 hypothetical protein SAMN05192569_105321 [Parageobacillus thermantarcticus]
MAFSVSVEDFILNTPIYRFEEFTYEDMPNVAEILFYEGIIDCYCVECKRNSTFHAVKNGRGGYPLVEIYNTYVNAGNVRGPHFAGVDLQNWKQGLYDSLTNGELYFVNKEFTCTRDEEHKIVLNYLVKGNKIAKVGQYPSLADLNQLDIRKYRKVLSKEKYLEFSKGIGLSSHGVGVGAFVYLRRIFEYLIQEAYDKAKSSPDWVDNDFSNKRMDEKILSLKDFLPQYLVENRKIYGILSKGIHELSEEVCLKIFPHVKLGIELILDEKLYELEREEKLKATKVTLEKIHASLLDD